MITAKIGKAVFTPQKDYAPGDLCQPLDVVALDGSLWACLEETRALPAQDSSYWMHLLDGGTARIINTTYPLTGGRSLADDITLGIADASEGDTLVYRKGKWTLGKAYELCEFYSFRHPVLKPGFMPAQGGLITDASVKYPEAWEYLLSEEGQMLCKTEAEWQAMTVATWHTNADGSKVGWDGIGGAPFYAPNILTGDLRLPDLRGMVAEAAGDGSLGVGDVQGDGIPPITGRLSYLYGLNGASGAFSYTAASPVGGNTGTGVYAGVATLDVSRVLAATGKVQPRSWGSLACVYLGKPAS